MSDGSDIEWCDATWQPVLGCTRVSAGCDHCYAISVVHRGMSPQHRGLTKLRPKDAARPGVDWNGTVRLQPEKLAEPLRWKKPRRVFVCSLADLFHASVPFEYIAAVFGVMAACPQHTFLVLTKRPERAREFFAWMEKRERDGMQVFPEDDAAWRIGQLLSVSAARAGCVVGHGNRPWPLPNVHLGTSIEDQATADERIPHLLSCPAALHWVSAEPLLGPVCLAKPMHADRGNCLRHTRMNAMYHLGWVVIGGESGPGARPFDIAWARSIIEQRDRHGLATRVFVKQLGANIRDRNDADFAFVDDSEENAWPESVTPDDIEDNPNGFREEYQGAPVRVHLRSSKGGDMSEWPADLRVREVPA